jgi:hypothetical protein
MVDCAGPARRLQDSLAVAMVVEAPRWPIHQSLAFIVTTNAGLWLAAFYGFKAAFS